MIKEKKPLEQFNTFTPAQKQVALLKRGTYLRERLFNGNKVLLYELWGFYVEIYFVGISNKVRSIKSFTDTDELYPYLNEISIPSLFKL